jgi:hypothetical protein
VSGTSAASATRPVARITSRVFPTATRRGARRSRDRGSGFAGLRRFGVRLQARSSRPRTDGRRLSSDRRRLRVATASGVRFECGARFNDRHGGAWPLSRREPRRPCAGRRSPPSASTCGLLVPQVVIPSSRCQLELRETNGEDAAISRRIRFNERRLPTGLSVGSSDQVPQGFLTQGSMAAAWTGGHRAPGGRRRSCRG